ncbi:hypothetical protein [Chitinophaga sancti]|uniref:Recombinase zinc beta ribbon domain-containing protein n=1 Tax=Chitinophaga sancti TaxID=1004 RepID=A0A1K1SYB1_9BACT|nr:hypothetical protein [Chitinophaga sancti]WQD63942.1 hypothetical protein U0033_06000 [Chitinophaga sancti]WQG90433.1 hypothetical protein SR876_02920 [Chitinophaga sancti]SFW89368.1 hypothetical protein SAMN05661012_06417 [Chitinophaga sancti]
MFTNTKKEAQRKKLQVNLLSIFLLRFHPVYCGKVFLAAYKNEAAHCVKGIHQPIVSEQLFDDVQDVLKGKKRKVRVNAFTEIDIHLPLRGFLICQRYGKPLRGSGSRGNGGIYYYYHCQSVKLCKERFRAETANEIFVKQLSKIAVNVDLDPLKQEKAGDISDLSAIVPRTREETNLIFKDLIMLCQFP